MRLPAPAKIREHQMYPRRRSKIKPAFCFVRQRESIANGRMVEGRKVPVAEGKRRIAVTGL